jgi:hypothetical protein
MTRGLVGCVVFAVISTGVIGYVAMNGAVGLAAAVTVCMLAQLAAMVVAAPALRPSTTPMPAFVRKKRINMLVWTTRGCAIAVCAITCAAPYLLGAGTVSIRSAVSVTVIVVAAFLLTGRLQRRIDAQIARI